MALLAGRSVAHLGVMCESQTQRTVYARPRDVDKDSCWWAVESYEGSDLTIYRCEADEFVCCVAFG